MKQLNLELSVQETNLVLSALSKLPFEQSAQLIAKIQAQAAPQLEERKPEGKSIEESK